ncbi:MAG: carboxypeptidase-like regulatory domain-containing protein [Lewinellaceae bacterium]|nr:carboxypeptidase-like regulatory domain-containing protein [Lewinellaceae bacterium]
MIRKFLFPCLLFLLTQTIDAQKITLQGVIPDAETEKPIADAAVIVTGSGKVAATDNNGRFKLTGLECSVCTLSVTHEGYTPVALEVSGAARSKSLDVLMNQVKNTETQPADIPTISLGEAESQEDGAGEVANLLHASRDVFQNVSGFGWSPFRFRERGYDSGLFLTYVNGVPFNDLETGFTPYAEFGGLNDVLRNRNSTVGLDPSDFAFSELGGATMIDTRAAVQRKQIRASYASANRTYRNRVMLTMSTGLMPGGWAVSVSGSKRWAEEGYVPGTFYDGYSYFVSVDKNSDQNTP